MLLNVGAVRAGSQAGFPITKKWLKDKHLSLTPDLGGTTEQKVLKSQRKAEGGSKGTPKTEPVEENRIARLPDALTVF